MREQLAAARYPLLRATIAVVIWIGVVSLVAKVTT